MDKALTDTEQRALRTLQSANVRLTERLDHELQQRAHLSLTDYEILAALAEAPGRRLRMSDLADQVLVSRSRLTYRVDRLVTTGLVARAECENDRRGLYAIVTETGIQAVNYAAPCHLTDVRTWFFDLIEPGELELLAEVMSRIDEKLASN